jgi:hypothetical protein
MKPWLFVVLLGCSSSETETPAVVVDSAVVDSTPAPDTAPVDTKMAPVCLVSGACFDEYAAKHKVADECFGHFGPGECGKFDTSKTTCKWTDNTSFEIVAVDGGEPTVVYKGKTGAECFRRLGNGDVVFPDGSKYKTTIAAGSKLTVSCESSGAFTCMSVQACVDCGIDLRVCCM